MPSSCPCTHSPLATALAPTLLASRSCPALLPSCLFVAHAQHCSCFLPAVHAAPCSYVCPLLLQLPGYVPTASLLFILWPTDLSRSCSATTICVAFAAVPANSVPLCAYISPDFATHYLAYLVFLSLSVSPIQAGRAPARLSSCHRPESPIHNTGMALPVPFSMPAKSHT